jgi:hypothetical protein
LYRGDFKKMYQQLDASYEGYPQQFSQYNPLLLIFSNPFDKAWLLSLPGELLDSILLCMLQHSLNVLTPAENAFELLLRRVGEPGSPRYMRYLLAEQLILRGRLPEAWRQLQDKTESAGVLALRGWLHFLQNDDQQALADYSSGIKLLRKAAGKRKVYLAELAGVFYVMALLHEGSAGSLKQAGDILTIVQSEPGFACPATYQALQALLSLRQGTIKYPDIQLADDVKTADFARVDGIFLLIILYWLDALEQTRLKTLAVELYERARRCNYLWLADELQTLLAELGHGQRPAAPHNMRRLTDLIRIPLPYLNKKPSARQ